jgi:hypothetical protein
MSRIDFRDITDGGLAESGRSGYGDHPPLAGQSPGDRSSVNRRTTGASRKAGCFTIESNRTDLLSPKRCVQTHARQRPWPTHLEPLPHPTKMSCFFLYSASRRANLSAQAAHTVYYLFELKSPHVNASAKFNRFRNRTDAEGFVSAGIGGVLDHVEIEEISEAKANRFKLGSPEQVTGGVLYSLDQADYRRLHSLWHRLLRMLQR